MLVKKRLKKQFGFSLLELIIVLLITAIIAVLALPQILASNRLWRFSGFQREIISLLREARQEAVSQRTTITFQYDDSTKRIILFGGNFGAFGDKKNRNYQTPAGNSGYEIVYGRIAGEPVTALGDGVQLTEVTAQKIEITFQSDGSITDKNNNLKNYGLFFYNSTNPFQTAFAVSVLGAGGRAKVWRYNQTLQIYAE